MSVKHLELFLGAQANRVLLAVEVQPERQRFPMLRQSRIEFKVIIAQFEARESEDRRLPDSACCRAVNTVTNVAFGIFEVDVRREDEQSVRFFDQTETRRQPRMSRRTELRSVINDLSVKFPVPQF